MKKLISVILSVVLVLTIMPAFTFSTQTEVSALEMFPPIMTEEQLEGNMFVKRLAKFDEHLNAIGYENEDGTETVFIYGEDIKYKDENGNIKDKDISVVSTGLLDKAAGYSYKTKSNDIETFFPNKLSGEKAVKITYKNYKIELAPKTENTIIESKAIKRVDKKSELTVEAQDATAVEAATAMTSKIETSATAEEIPVSDNIMQYDQTFDTDTHIRFETTYNGIKEDIILNKYTGTNRFAFTLDVGNLIAKEYNKGARIYDGDTVVAEIPPAYVEDSVGNFTIDNNMTVTENADGTYEITIIVDSAFLTDESTVYPVVVDPSANFTSPKHTDATVYEKRPNANFGNQVQNHVGSNSTYGDAWFYVKFDISSLGNLKYTNILSAYYHCQEQTHQTANSVVEVFLPFDDWDEDTITWNNKPSYNWEKICAMNINATQKSIAENHWYNFYITSAVMAWQQGVPNYGLIFKEHTNSMWKAFGASEGDPTYPYMRVTYFTDVEYSEALGLDGGQHYYIKNKRSNKYLTNAGASDGANVYQASFTGNTNQKWRLQHISNGYYRITPINSTGRALEVYNGSTSPSGNTNEANIQINTYSSGTNQQWKIVRNWNGTYRFLSRISSANRAMVVKQGLKESGVNVFQYTYSSDYMYNDDWTLEPVTLSAADFYTTNTINVAGISQPINSAKRVNEAMAITESMGMLSLNWVNVHAKTAYNYMDDTDLFYFIGHGLDNLIAFTEVKSDGTWTDSFISSGGTTNTSTYYYINAMEQNSLNDLDLAVFASCRTGNDGNDTNMIGATFIRGAHYVISYTHRVGTTSNADWMIEFLTAINNGYCIYDAMEAADEYLYSISATYPDGAYVGNLNHRHTLGDGSIVLKH